MLMLSEPESAATGALLVGQTKSTGAKLFSSSTRMKTVFSGALGLVDAAEKRLGEDILQSDRLVVIPGAMPGALMASSVA